VTIDVEDVEGVKYGANRRASSFKNQLGHEQIISHDSSGQLTIV